MVRARCPVCDEIVDPGEKPEVGEVVTRPECGAELKVKKRRRRYYLREVEEEYGEELGLPRGATSRYLSRPLIRACIEISLSAGSRP